MKEIILNKKYICLVDDEDFNLLSQYKWTPIRQGKLKYRAYCYTLKIYMHRFIMNCPKGLTIDHIDGNPLNNQKLNLRICTLYENTRNTNKKGKNNTSKYKGVYFDNRKENLSKRWVAQIKINYKTYKLGRFLTEEEAAARYDVKAIEAWGEFANLNFKK